MCSVGRKEGSSRSTSSDTHDDRSLHPRVNVVVQPDLNLGFLEGVKIKQLEEISI